MTATTPNGIRTESERTPFASIDKRYLHSTTRQIPVALATHLQTAPSAFASACRYAELRCER